MKSKSLQNIEEKMQGLDKDSLRYHILESAKSFKVSWVELGRSLYTVHKDRLYKDWGYEKFDTYTAKEIGIKKPTAMKLLRSYYFLEKEEPRYLTSDYAKSAEAKQIPTFETVDLLRRAKNNKLDEDDYEKLKNNIEEGKDLTELKRDLTSLIKQREELEPEEAFKRRRVATVKRFLGALKAIRKEAELSKLLPPPLLKEAQDLIKKIETQLA